jgi:hypothetical protein
VITLPDRSRLADYSRLQLPAAYYQRVLRNLGQAVPMTADMTWDRLDRALAERIASLSPYRDSLADYDRAGRSLAAQAAALRARGGKAYFVVLPKSGHIKAMDDQRYPRALFWDRFAALSQAPALHFEDVAGLRELKCPDGSHLDYRDRARFTAALVEALGLDAR